MYKFNDEIKSLIISALEYFKRPPFLHPALISDDKLPRLESALNRFVDTLSTINITMPDDNKLLIHVFFCRDDRCGAFAGKYRDNIIGVYDGLVLSLYDVYCRLLSHDQLLIGVGDPSREVFSSISFENSGLPAWWRWRESASPLPVDEVRAEFAQIMFELSLDFAICHEYAHIIYGHLEYIGAQGNLEFVGDGDVKNSNGLDPMKNQVLEMLADTFSVNICFERVMRMYNNGSGVDNQGAALSAFNRTRHEALFYWLLAIFLSFRVMDPNNWDVSDYEKVGHPPMPTRVALILAVVQDCIDSFGDPALTEDYKVCVQLLGLVGEMMFSIAFSTKANKDGISKGFLEESHVHYYKLIDLWRNMREELAPYSRVIPLPSSEHL